MATDDLAANESARRLKRDWEARGVSPTRDYYVASHDGWDDPERWNRQAVQDAAFILQGAEARLRTADVLEVGCGVGRLAPHIVARVSTYTGIDVAASMISEARRRHGALPAVRFFESDGLTIPSEARDRRYDFTLAHAVLIHCPKSVIRALIMSAWAQTSAGGEIRLQLRADPADPEGAPPPPEPMRPRTNRVAST